MLGPSSKTWCFAFGVRRWWKKENRMGWDLTWALPTGTGRYQLEDTAEQRLALRWHLGKLEIVWSWWVCGFAMSGQWDPGRVGRTQEPRLRVKPDTWSVLRSMTLRCLSRRKKFEIDSMSWRWALGRWKLWKRGVGWWKDGLWLRNRTELSDLSA